MAPRGRVIGRQLEPLSSGRHEVSAGSVRKKEAVNLAVKSHIVRRPSQQRNCSDFAIFCNRLQTLLRSRWSLPWERPVSGDIKSGPCLESLQVRQHQDHKSQRFPACLQRSQVLCRPLNFTAPKVLCFGIMGQLFLVASLEFR